MYLRDWIFHRRHGMDNTEYKAVYKCRLCDEIFTCGKVYTENEVFEKIAEISTILVLSPNDKGNIAHGCKNGSIGIADLKGFKKINI